MNEDTLLIIACTVLGTIGVLMGSWDSIMIAVFQWSYGKVTEQQAWDMHYFHEEKSQMFQKLGGQQAEFHKSRSIMYYRYAVRMHARNLGYKHKE